MNQIQPDDSPSDMNDLKRKNIGKPADFLCDHELVTLCWRTLIHETTSIIIVVDDCLTIRQLYGKKFFPDSLNAPIGCSLLKYIAASYHDKAVHMLLDGSGEKTRRFELPMILTSAQEQWFDIYQQSLLCNDKVYGHFLFGVEITKQKACEERQLHLMQQLDLLQKTLESTDAFIFSLDTAYRYTSFNSQHALAMKKLCGCDIQIGDNFLEVIKKSGTYKKYKLNIDRSLQGEQFTAEAYVYLNEGELTNLSILHTPVKDQNGTISGTIISAKNITARKMVEDELRKHKENLEELVKIRTGQLMVSEERNRQLVSMSPDAVCVVLKEKVIFANESMRKFLKMNEQEKIIGQSILRFFPKENHEFVRELFNKVLMGNGPFPSFYNKIVASDGSSLANVEITGAAIFYHDLPTLQIIMRDITERILFQDQLQNTLKLESLGILAGGLAHDFNNFFAGLYNCFQLLKDAIPANSDLSECLEESTNVFNRARLLTQQLLTFSRGGAPQFESIAINELIIEAVNFALIESDCTTEFSIEKDLWQCTVDKNQIKQVIDNIIINARQAMPIGGMISVSASNEINPAVLPANECGNKRFVHITIADTGLGISKENCAKIFDPFFTTKRKGYGLGLTIVYSIIKKHRGFIQVESQNGKGTTIHIFLPASEQQNTAVTIKQKSPVPQDTRILIVDDEASIRISAQKILQNRGYHVDSAATSIEAITLFRNYFERNERFNVVIIDLILPETTNGVELLASLRQIDPDVVALVCSGYADDPVMIEPLKYGFLAALPKPYSLEALFSTVQKLLSVKISL
ncbi:MAG: PAS domain S-box protein [Chitinivibrionales bacterium]|nr:PAS domain S-box protein [Chitinivibrionales bacterium]